MLTIEVFQEDVNVTSRKLPPKDGNEGRVFYEQTAYAHLGDKFPVKMTLQVDGPAAVYPAGKYEISEKSFVINNFGGLELKRFGLVINKLDKQTSSAPVISK
ncbi:hypothetical protein EXU30_00385 [Shewanella maritima]|uniref:Single-stranded DNA-binding protein n=1 Tax=Shewanella maritima TaxID=2520507 RepID=A0A411PCQ8_9GAMM|nr:single-stranded DNA-binding protein [Shewanella maritima]QBF81321.1 hypothetical protein EXU30_00355 [Shewanella maritima]QBF81326.1 hypothetical protein EXU30_00385 [Shewanella maritima]